MRILLAGLVLLALLTPAADAGECPTYACADTAATVAGDGRCDPAGETSFWDVRVSATTGPQAAAPVDAAEVRARHVCAANSWGSRGEESASASVSEASTTTGASAMWSEDNGPTLGWCRTRVAVGPPAAHAEELGCPVGGPHTFPNGPLYECIRTGNC